MGMLAQEYLPPDGCTVSDVRLGETFANVYSSIGDDIISFFFCRPDLLILRLDQHLCHSERQRRISLLVTDL